MNVVIFNDYMNIHVRSRYVNLDVYFSLYPKNESEKIMETRNMYFDGDIPENLISLFSKLDV